LRKNHLDSISLDNLVKARQVSRALSRWKDVGPVDPTVQFEARLVNISSIEEQFLAVIANTQTPAYIVTGAASRTGDQNTSHYDTPVSRFVPLWGSVNLSSDASLTYTLELWLLSFIVLAVKSVWQYYVSSSDVLGLLGVFRRMVNESLRIGMGNRASSLRKLSLLSYNQLAQYDSPSYYKLCAISRAAGILAARKKSTRRGYATRTPYAFRQHLVS